MIPNWISLCLPIDFYVSRLFKFICFFSRRTSYVELEPLCHSIKIKLLEAMVIKFLLLFSLEMCSLHCANILAILPVPYYSHQVVIRALMKDLAARGHKLTIITTHLYNYENQNVTQIHLNESQKIYEDISNQLTYKKSSKIWSVLNEIKAYHVLTEQQLSHHQVQDLIVSSEKQKFDLLITDCPLFCPIIAFAEVFDCPIINFATCDYHVSLLKQMGNEVNPVIHPERYLLQYVHGKLTFKERLEAFMLNILLEFIVEPFFSYVDNNFIRKFFPEHNMSMKDLKSRIAMNFFHVLTTIRPLLPNTIPLHFMPVEPPEPLANGIIKSFLDQSINGVILMSLGSNVQSRNMTLSQIDLFTKVFNSLPFEILWKFEGQLNDKDENVMTVEWLPQSDVLSHQKIKLFITHGGLGSIQESIDREIPMIIIPLAFEQSANANEMVDTGVACSLNLNSVNDSSLRNSIFEMMKPKYKDNIKALRKQMQDQPQTSREKAVWFSEYVIRHKGANHLQYPGKFVPFHQKYCFDIILLFMLLAFGLCKLTSKLLVSCCHFQKEPNQVKFMRICLSSYAFFLSLLVTYALLFTALTLQH